MLAVLKAGGAYLPLDLSYPSDRLKYLLDDSEASFAIVDTTTANKIRANVKRWICLDIEVNAITACSLDNPSQVVQPSNLAYVIYTSGSTGQPKGVENLHQGIARLVKNIDYAQLGPEEVFLQLTSISFDVSAFEIYGALLNGGSLVLMGTGRPSIAEIGQTIRKYHVNSLCITPQMLEMVLTECARDLSGIRQIFAAGDVLPVSLARKVLAQLPCRLINAYGPTENTVYSTCYTVNQLSLNNRSIPIGRPIASDCAYILDQHLQPVPIGITGDLYVSGIGVARGYRRNPQMTAERFLVDPFIAKAGIRMYKTGDIARRLSDGNIEFIGRLDNQIKIRGCRVEPGEVAAVLRQHSNIQQAIVIARRISAENELNAYVVLKAGKCVSRGIALLCKAEAPRIHGTGILHRSSPFPAYTCRENRL
jgi:amino acid adenylation domain-containing protein